MPRIEGIAVVSAATPRKPAMNQGTVTGVDAVSSAPGERARVNATMNVTGTIQRARASFAAVATSSALSPYCAAAPTTELVS
jgi:hypothetical protein